jgi:hypothetical protein
VQIVLSSETLRRWFAATAFLPAQIVPTTSGTGVTVENMGEGTVTGCSGGTGDLVTVYNDALLAKISHFFCYKLHAGLLSQTPEVIDAASPDAL